MSIKTTDLRPCDHCKGPINPYFYRIEIKFRQVLINQTAVREVLGTAQILGNNLALGSVMSPNKDVLIESPAYNVDVDLWICPKCIGEIKIDFLDLMIESEEKEE